MRKGKRMSIRPDDEGEALARAQGYEIRKSSNLEYLKRKDRMNTIHLLDEFSKKRPKAICGMRKWVSLSSEVINVDCPECLQQRKKDERT